MKFWEFPFGVKVEAPDSAMRRLEELATDCAGANWGVEFDCTAMHFRFDRGEDVTKFILVCMALGHKATRDEAAMAAFAKSWRRELQWTPKTEVEATSILPSLNGKTALS
jgi:hypothetical protein